MIYELYLKILMKKKKEMKMTRVLQGPDMKLGIK